MTPTPHAGPGLEIGTRAADFRLNGLQGDTLTLEALRAAGRPVLMLFTNPSCGPCQAMMPDIARWQRELASALTVVVISEGTVEENRPKIIDHGLTNVLLQRKREVAETYQA